MAHRFSNPKNTRDEIKARAINDLGSYVSGIILSKTVLDEIKKVTKELLTQPAYTVIKMKCGFYYTFKDGLGVINYRGPFLTAEKTRKAAKEYLG